MRLQSELFTKDPGLNLSQFNAYFAHFPHLRATQRGQIWEFPAQIEKGQDEKDSYNQWPSVQSVLECITHICLLAGPDLQQMDEAGEYFSMLH